MDEVGTTRFRFWLPAEEPELIHY